MKKYYIIKKDRNTGNETILETVSKKNLTEARKYATSTYFFNIDVFTEELIVVGESGYKQYHK